MVNISVTDVRNVYQHLKYVSHLASHEIVDTKMWDNNVDLK